jgi:RNA polymerase sigma factor (sigma-70 family)
VIEVAAFDEVWSEMHDRLARVLAARGVPAQDREDLLQETALRLYRVWGTLDPEQPVWPYAVTIALNLWRDGLRAAGSRLREVSGAMLTESAADLDVERTVIARQELADVGAALRRLAPEQRRLVLETDEITSVVRPLVAAERMSRMRVRRELARVVGRASAIAALIWLRRPHRAQAMTAVAFTGALAATVFSGAPAVSVANADPVAPAASAPVWTAPVAVVHVRPVAAVRPVPARAAAPRVRAAVVHRAKPAQVCAPASAPPPSSQMSSSVHTVDPTASGPLAGVLPATRPTVTTPTANATSDGCVQVS